MSLKNLELQKWFDSNGVTKVGNQTYGSVGSGKKTIEHAYQCQSANHPGVHYDWDLWETYIRNSSESLGF